MKSLSAAIAALSLAFAAAGAQAAPVSLSFSDNTIQSDGNDADAFSNTFGFVLNGQTLLSALITTHTPEIGAEPWVNITSAFLKSVSTGQIYNLTETVAVNWDNDESGVETWKLPSQWLAAGSWELHVAGEGWGTKALEGYTAELTGTAAELPEPTALALVAVALAGLSLSRRRSV